MKVLSVSQPYATLLVRGFKTIETKSLITHHRGPLLIHSCKLFSAAKKVLCSNFPYNIYIQDPEVLPLGCIVGSVDITGVDYVENLTKKISDYEIIFGDYSQGRYGWICSSPVEFSDPIPVRGQQGLWNYDLDIVKELAV